MARKGLGRGLDAIFGNDDAAAEEGRKEKGAAKASLQKVKKASGDEAEKTSKEPSGEKAEKAPEGGTSSGRKASARASEKKRSRRFSAT